MCLLNKAHRLIGLSMGFFVIDFRNRIVYMTDFCNGLSSCLLFGLYFKFQMYIRQFNLVLIAFKSFDVYGSTAAQRLIFETIKIQLKEQRAVTVSKLIT